MGLFVMMLFCAFYAYIIQKGSFVYDKRAFLLERVMGVEPTYQPWEGRILPMNYTRVFNCEHYYSTPF